MLRALGAEIRRLVAHPRAPLIALALILLYSLGARVFYLGEPCSSPCLTGSSHTLIFDEAYYVNAARVIDGIHPPAGDPYADAPLHKDPNAEHPQLAKLIIAAGIELFGDDPWGWRIGSVLFGLIAILAMYALVRSARGSPWLAVGASGVMALDNLMLVSSRIATLDVYFVAMALVAAVFYVRGWALASGIALGVASCMKLEALARGAGPGALRGLPNGLGAQRRSGDLADGAGSRGSAGGHRRGRSDHAPAGRLADGCARSRLRPRHAHHLRREPVHPHRAHALLRRRAQGDPERDGDQLDPAAVACRSGSDQLRARRGELDLRREDHCQQGAVRRQGRDEPVRDLPRHSGAARGDRQPPGASATASPRSAPPGAWGRSSRS